MFLCALVLFVIPSGSPTGQVPESSAKGQEHHGSRKEVITTEQSLGAALLLCSLSPAISDLEAFVSGVLSLTSVKEGRF